MKKTKWFDGSVKPVHVGVYERKYDGLQIHYCYWNGIQFMFACTTARSAVGERKISNREDLPWRGLAENPASK